MKSRAWDRKVRAELRGVLRHFWGQWLTTRLLADVVGVGYLTAKQQLKALRRETTQLETRRRAPGAPVAWMWRKPVPPGRKK